MNRWSRSLAQIFIAPLAIGAAIIAGLILGLTGDGIGDMAAWVLTAIAPLVLLYALRRSTLSPNPQNRNGH